VKAFDDLLLAPADCGHADLHWSTIDAVVSTPLGEVCYARACHHSFCWRATHIHAGPTNVVALNESGFPTGFCESDRQRCASLA
jgi:hypothetical protein